MWMYASHTPAKHLSLQAMLLAFDGNKSISHMDAGKWMLLYTRYFLMHLLKQYFVFDSNGIGVSSSQVNCWKSVLIYEMSWRRTWRIPLATSIIMTIMTHIYVNKASYLRHQQPIIEHVQPHITCNVAWHDNPIAAKTANIWAPEGRKWQ